MDLYLVRHGYAVGADKDPARPLSQKGRDEVQKVAEELARKKLTLNEIWHSDKLRASQTAEIIAENLQMKDLLKQRDGLRPDDSEEAIAWDIEALYHEHPDYSLMIVGHLPFMDKLAYHYLKNTKETDLIYFEEATVLYLHSLSEKRWKGEWRMNPFTLSRKKV